MTLLRWLMDRWPRPSRRFDEAIAEALYRGLKHDEVMERRMPGLPLRLPPLPAGAIGWNVYSAAEPDNPSFMGFVGDEQAVSRLGAELADDVERFAAATDS